MEVSRSWWEEKIDSCYSTDIKFQLYKMNKFRRHAVQLSAIVNYTVLCT